MAESAVAKAPDSCGIKRRFPLAKMPGDCRVTGNPEITSWLMA